MSDHLDDSQGSYYPPSQPSPDYYYSSSSLHLRPSPSHSAPGGASEGPRTPNPSESYYLPNQTFSEDSFNLFARLFRVPGDNQQSSSSHGTSLPSGVESNPTFWSSLYQQADRPVEIFTHFDQSDYVIKNDENGAISLACMQRDVSDSNTGSSDSANMQQMDGSRIFPDDGVLPPTSPTHSYVQNGTPSSSKVIDTHIRPMVSNDGARSYACLYSGCSRSGTFSRKTEAVTHVRSVHLREKPFGCSCGKSYAHKPDAMRHVRTKIAGRRYKCSVCSGAFERKDYRDHHEAQCLSRN